VAWNPQLDGPQVSPAFCVVRVGRLSRDDKFVLDGQRDTVGKKSLAFLLWSLPFPIDLIYAWRAPSINLDAGIEMVITAVAFARNIPLLSIQFQVNRK
jgi:hypothetical protein